MLCRRPCVADKLCSTPTVGKWKKRFLVDGLETSKLTAACAPKSSMPAASLSTHCLPQTRQRTQHQQRPVIVFGGKPTSSSVHASRRLAAVSRTRRAARCLSTLRRQPLAAFALHFTPTYRQPYVIAAGISPLKKGRAGYARLRNDMAQRRCLVVGRSRLLTTAEIPRVAVTNPLSIEHVPITKRAAVGPAGPV